MLQSGFKFDTNQCVGCHACSIACSIENNLGYDTSWRQIITYNPGRIENLYNYHLSLACNHCTDAVCIEQCPARAIHKEKNGVVLIDDNKCIGCKFCGWVCPYDAPIYDETQKTMTKCTLCTHRIDEELKPACVTICPTNALEFDTIQVPRKTEKIDGFPPSDIQPAILIKKPDCGQFPPEKVDIPYSKELIEKYTEHFTGSKSKINVLNEWALIFFTFSVAVLGGILSVSVISQIFINPYAFLTASILILGLSTIHLGKKFRAYRAVLNWKSSWLSREIIFVSGFITFAVAFLFTNLSSLGYIALVFVFVSAFAIDKVYTVTAQVNKTTFHSSQILLSLIFFIFLFNNIIPGVILITVIKLALYLKRKVLSKHSGLNILFFVRIFTLLAGSSLTVFNFTHEFYPVIILLLISEFIDRIQFYDELDIITPARHMELNFKKKLKSSAYEK